MPIRLCYWSALLLLLLLGMHWSSVTASAQAAPRPLLTDEAEVSILTIYPGPALHARFGHTAIRVADPLQALDIVYNYGTFDFDSPIFIATFIRGQLDYHLSVAPMDAALHHYQYVERRAVVEQALDLTPGERERVFAYLRENAREENREYRYRFLDDNCSTRVRDVFEDVLGDALRFDAAEPPLVTYRDKLSPYMADAPLLWLGMDLALGRPTDRSLGVREVMFLPLPLMEVFDVATVTVDGETRQLVRETRMLYWFDEADEWPSGFAWPTWLAWGVLGLALVVTWREARQPGVAAVQRRRGAVLADALLLMVVGAGGLVMAGLWGATEHDVAGPNWNLWWAWPTHVVAAMALLRWPGGGPWLRRYLILTAAGAGVAALTSPWWPQSMPWAVLPVLLVLVLRAGWLGWSMTVSPIGGETADTTLRSTSTA
ncbi:DUF4105 domain-containing protein [Phycisphaerales bacterium AB-hyl4]|uniref:DUF4105 domain-containing protein n=1 Tax=Natronomicrosphaera hydrolytica TaxID=3242702 RepID=A0ABV4U3C6_9BACT